MFSVRLHVTRRATIAALAATLAASAAGAATVHRLSISQTTGSESAQTVLQNSASSSAFQGEVGGSSANSNIKIPFGVLGEYDPAGSTFGIGLLGITTTGYAVAAEALGGQPTILGFAGGSGIGIEATTPAASSSEAFYGEAKGSGDGADLAADGDGYGIYAGSKSGIGILGYSTGTTSSGAGIAGEAAAGSGVEGYNVATASPAPSAAPFALTGTYGQSNDGPGVYGVDIHDTGTPVAFGSNTGGHADYFSGLYGFANDGPGISTYSYSDFGALITNGGGETTLVINADNNHGSGADLIQASAGNIATDPVVFAVDQSGNVVSTGTINAVGRNPASDAATYSAQQTEATIEDVGSGRLVNGTGAVPIAADFRQQMDAANPYMVFLTPYGDNRGLYVASRTASGFIVKEAQGGRASLAFDYRIVARPYGTRLARLPHLRARLAARKSSPVQRLARGAHFDGAPPAGTSGFAPDGGARALAQIGAHRERTAPPAAPALLAPASLRR